MSEAKGRGASWTEERGTSDEGRWRSVGGMGRRAGPRRRAGDAAAAGPHRPDEPGASQSAGPRVLILLAVAAGVLALDIASKAIVVATLSDRPPIRLLGGLLTLRESRNSGAAFSFGTSMTVVFTLIAVGVIVFILRTSRRIYSLPWAVALGLLLGGAMGNLTDRIFRFPGPFRGWVVDWIELPHWPVFNLADSAIVCGGVLMVLIAARGHRIDGKVPTADSRSRSGQSRSERRQGHPSGGGRG
jgi:signal peptidase II